MTRRRLCVLAAVLGLAALCAAAQPAPRPDPILILVSLDGWRWDYTDRLPVPNLRAVAARGVRVRQLVPSFPALTFPNHYTIVTGLYPAHHGIVANTMNDPSIGERFSMSAATAKDPRWWGGEPIWVTAIRQGRRAATMFWPGSEVEIGGVRPTYWKPFDGSLPSHARTAQVVKWLALPEGERPSVITLYFDEVDHAGHDFGPASAQLAAAAANLDRELGSLLEAVKRLGLSDRVTIVAVSDHGMAPVSEQRVIWLDDYVDVNGVDVTQWDGFLALAPRAGSTVSADDLYRRLRHVHPRLHVYTRETTPARLHYRGNPRIALVIGIPDIGWIVSTRQRQQQRREDGRGPERGAHGFDPANPLMHALFVAAGPDIRRGVVVPSLDNVHVYQFLCAVAKLTPAANDGDPRAIRPLLR